MQLIINGVLQETNARTIQALIADLDIETKVMAAAVNMNVIKKEQWSSFELHENDKVEFLQFVGGG
ncbi:sulfur carrier protein ThiS [Sulfurospirillum sp. hDNRA2]|uniref:sulfur carrier protein ThiS n=1 Tax=Sulfurospirillum sp. hDNRA2 TaxID=3237298 RepID=UPI0020B7962A|nr:sulfur carrier protein ThiS [Sulfurospirillum sp. DNRA8]MCP3651539.1 sulfur carrier protein ThiS [Sulfurospirillum sp. DNRA8]MCR1810386.1 sulfur carrier protein ThiS [Sulfurospirillum sp. DNRA8]